MKKLILLLVLILMLVTIVFGYQYFSDPKRVCRDLQPDETCVCTDDVPISVCGIEKKKPPE